jgi:hypothetical protein
MKKFCEIFPNIKELTFYVIQLNDVFFFNKEFIKINKFKCIYISPLDDRDHFSVLL